VRKRKVTYPRPKTDTKRAPAPGVAGDPPARPTMATIDMRARIGRSGFAVGDHVRIIGQGLLSGERAVVEALSGGAILAAFVRTESGRTRRVRTIDLEPVADPGPPQQAQGSPSDQAGRQGPNKT
jgi:hypothetical protein